MKPEELEIGDSLLFHSEPEDELGRTVVYGIQNLTKSPYNHVATYVGLGQLTEAVAEGYKKHTLTEAISKADKKVAVFRYHADGVEGEPLTAEQQVSMVHTAERFLDLPYAFSQIAFLAVLCEVNKVNIPESILAPAFEFFQMLVERNKTMLICSEADYRIKNEAGLQMRIVDENSRYEFYKTSGEITSKYREVKASSLVDNVIADWVTPNDIAMCPDMIYIGDLEL